MKNFLTDQLFPLRVNSEVECVQEITSEGALTSQPPLNYDPMSSEEDKQTHCLQDVLDDPDVQLRARFWAERLVRRYNLAPMEGEDLYQEVIIKLIRYAQSKEQPEIKKPLSFMFTVLSNQARTSYQLRARTAGHEQEIPSWAVSDNFDAVRRMELGILLNETFRSLDNDGDRELFRCVLNGYSTRQAAAILKISHVTAAHRINLIKARIRKVLWNRPD